MQYDRFKQARSRGMEILERRNLLAGDFLAGDANRDYHFDEADFVQVSKTALFETDLPAIWEQGDWSGDGIYNSRDLVEAFKEGVYLTGAYDPDAGAPINDLGEISTSGDAETTVYYATENGDVAVVPTQGKATSVHLASRAGIFLNSERQYAGIFDVATSTSQFVFSPSGEVAIVIQDALTSGLNESQLLGDLLIDGAVFTGGGLGNVRLQLVDVLPDSLQDPVDPDPPNPDPPEIEGLAPGDANEDYYFDESDFVFVMKAGKFDTGQPATWAEGDWSGDGLFTTQDFVRAFQVGAFRLGAYNENAEEPVNELTSLETNGNQDVTLYYDSESGNLTVVSNTLTKMTSIQVESARGQFSESTDLEGIFDVSTDSTQFLLDPQGEVVFHWNAVLPGGLSLEQVAADIKIDGSLLGGGGLGTVNLDTAQNMPEGTVPAELLYPDSPGPLDGFVDAADADANLTYDPGTGDVSILTKPGVQIGAIEIVSQSGIFVGTNTNDYTIGVFDVAVPTKFFRLTPDGSDSISLPAIAETGLTAQQFTHDVTIMGSIIGGGRLKVSLSLPGLGAVPGVRSCGQILADGHSPGDANLDGTFNSTDLIIVYQAGHFETGEEATWAEGDWNCDGIFNTSDMVSAFQSGTYSAAAIAGAIEPLPETQSHSDENKKSNFDGRIQALSSDRTPAILAAVDEIMASL